MLITPIILLLELKLSELDNPTKKIIPIGFPKLVTLLVNPKGHPKTQTLVKLEDLANDPRLLDKISKQAPSSANAYLLGEPEIYNGESAVHRILYNPVGSSGVVEENHFFTIYQIYVRPVQYFQVI